MAWTVPTDFATDQIVTEAHMDAISNNLRYLKGLDGAVAISDSLSVPNGKLLGWSGGATAVRNPYGDLSHFEMGYNNIPLNSTTTINFTTAYKGGTTPKVLVYPPEGTNNDTIHLHAASITVNGFDVHNTDGANAHYVFWIAFGVDTDSP